MKYRRLDGELYVESEGNSETLYRIAKHRLTHRIHCGCPDFKYRRWAKGEDCKHIKDFKTQFCAMLMC